MKPLAIALSLLLVLGACSPRHPDSPRATVLVEAAGLSEIHGPVGWSGTGWYIAGNASASVVLTAGHVCLGPADTVVMAFYEADGRAAYAFYDVDGGLDEDVCLLLVDGPAPAVIPLADSPAAPGDRVVYHGYPGGVRGFYRGDVVEASPASFHVSIPGYYGASGSAVTRDGRAVGVLVQGNMHLGPVGSVYATGLPALRRARAAALGVLERLEREPLKTVRDVVLASVTGAR